MSQFDEQKRFSNKLFQSHSFLQTHLDFKKDFPFEALIKHLQKGFRILQFGCGYGDILNALYQHGYQNVFGIDFFEGMIAVARKKYSRISKNLAVHEPFQVPFPKGWFDIIILNKVLTCIINDDDQKTLLQKIRNTLKKNGLVFICDYFVSSQQKDAKLYAAYQQKHKTQTDGVFEIEDGVIFRHHKPKWVLELTKDFDLIDMQQISCTTLTKRNIGGFYYLGKPKQISKEYL